MNLGVSIKLIRRGKSLNQYQLAEKCGISQTSLSQIETGAKRPSQRTINELCRVLEVPESVIYILGMQEGDIPESKKKVYAMIFPSIKDLAMQIVSDDYTEMVTRNIAV